MRLLVTWLCVCMRMRFTCMRFCVYVHASAFVHANAIYSNNITPFENRENCALHVYGSSFAALIRHLGICHSVTV